MVRPDRPGVRPDRSGQGSGLSGRPDRPAGLRQPWKRPQTVDEAALAAMELESYLHPCKPMTVGFLPMSQNTAPATTDEDDGTASSIAAM